MFRTFGIFLLLLTLHTTDAFLPSARADQKSFSCTESMVNGLQMQQVGSKPRYFQSRPLCPSGTHTTGGGFRREFAIESVQDKWRIDASFPVATNKKIESWACWAKYIGPEPIPTSAPGTFWCYAVCCPNKKK